MAKPAQLVAEAAGEGYLRIGFKQGDEWMRTEEGGEGAVILLQYPVQGERMRIEGEPSETELKARLITAGVDMANAFLKTWCS